MSNELKAEDKTLKQEIYVRMDPHLVDLPWKKKVELIDSIGASAGSKALIVDLDFSHTGRRINRRVYSKAGHMMVPGDLTHPYPKPITIDHEDGVKNIIGRIVSASYVDTTDEAKAYFRKRRLSDSGLAQIIDGLSDLDYQKAAAGFHKTKILNDKNWKGIGRVAAKARITDGDAIIKFFDQRYLTFSAEQDSDEYVCSICFQDWYKDGYCGHDPGAMVDGKLAFMMTGRMKGMGSSVVTHPADPDSIVTALSLSDSDGDDDHAKMFNRIIDTFIVDGKSQIEDEPKKELEMKDLLAKLLKGETLTDEERDTLYTSVFEQEGLKDKTIIVDGKEILVANEKLSKEDIALLPKSAFVNGFPIHDSSHAVAFDLATKSSEFDLSEDLKVLIDSKLKALGLTNEDISKEIEAVKDTVESAKKMFNDHYTEIVSGLSDDDIKKLYESISDKAKALGLFVDVTAFETKIVELQDSIAQATVALNSSKEEALVSGERAKALGVQYRELMNDHRELAKLYGKNTSETDELLDRVVTLVKVLDQTSNISDKNIKNINRLLDSVDVKTLESKLNDGLQKKTVQPETDPTVQAPKNNFTAYEEGVLTRYKAIKDSSGEKAAKTYFNSVKQYCSRNFNPSDMEK